MTPPKIPLRGLFQSRRARREDSDRREARVKTVELSFQSRRARREDSDLGGGSRRPRVVVPPSEGFNLDAREGRILTTKLSAPIRGTHGFQSRRARREDSDLLVNFAISGLWLFQSRRARREDSDFDDSAENPAQGFVSISTREKGGF